MGRKKERLSKMPVPTKYYVLNLTQFITTLVQKGRLWESDKVK